MSIIYIDPSATFDGDGTTGLQASSGGAVGAYNTLNSITITTNDSYYIKRGTTFNYIDSPLSRLIIDAKTNITVGAYYLKNGVEHVDSNTDEVLPILTNYETSTSTGDWTEIETNVWVNDIGTQFIKTPLIAGLGTLGSNLEMQAPYLDNINVTNTVSPGINVFDTFGEWDSTNGSADISISVIGAGNPTTVTLSSSSEFSNTTGGWVLLEGITITAGPDINGWHLATFITDTICVIPVDATGGSYSGGSFDRGAKLCIYSDANPITKWGTVYYNNSQDAAILVRNANTDITIENINFKHCGSGVQANTGPMTNLIVDNCESDNCWIPINGGNNSNAFTDTIISNNTLSNSRAAAIALDGKQNGGKYHSNRILNTGICNAYGAIYLGDAAVDTTLSIYNNYVDGMVSTKVFIYESHAYYPDSGCTNIKIYNNYAINCFGANYDPESRIVTGGAGVHLNSGLAGMEVWGNIVEDCHKGLSVSDSNNEELQTHVFRNNTTVNCVIGIQISGIDVGTTDVTDNIFYSDNITDSIGIKINTNSEANVTQDYNLVYGFTKDIGRAFDTAGTVTLGSNSITEDPKLNTKYIPSIYVAVGTKAWGAGPRLLDFNGKALPDYGINIGAIQ